MNALIIEDEEKVAEAVGAGLRAEGFGVKRATTGEEGFFLLETQSFDVVILDLGLPGRDGLEILRAIRKRGEQVPVLIMTARDTLNERVEGLDNGADDYLVKPFAIAELLARVRALLRRHAPRDIVHLQIADLELHLLQRTVRRGDQEIVLTAREFELLAYLLEHKQNRVTRRMLARDVWKEPMRATSLDNVIDVHMAKLRKKVDEPFPVKLIHTIRGVGFVLKESPG